ncbi:hypothetical protein CDAR_553731 [Caerostris darwini]|uniref:Uncharacterized protein n=1 Tax=Caerostris darwini TaxID=1538125 RepID=A0AAV4WKC9_9ARAC|nr:hypothetical protein CDAR_553731 [Caerostris darwini]
MDFHLGCRIVGDSGASGGRILAKRVLNMMECFILFDVCVWRWGCMNGEPVVSEREREVASPGCVRSILTIVESGYWPSSDLANRILEDCLLECKLNICSGSLKKLFY